MNEHPRVELDDEHRALLGAYRVRHDIPSDTQARVWRRLARADAPPTEPDTQPRRPRLWALALVAAVLIAFVGAIWGPRVLERSESAPSEAEYERRAPEPRPATHVPSDDRPRPEPVHEAPAPPDPEMQAVEPMPVAPPEVDAETSAPKARAPHRQKREAAADDPPASTPDSLRAEARLLGRAQAALGEGRPEAALPALAEHARRFPTGAMTEERRALEVIALCQSGRSDRGRKRLRAFLRAFPRSVLRQRVRDACEDG